MVQAARELSDNATATEAATQQAHAQQEQHWQARIQEVTVILMTRLPLMHSVWKSMMNATGLMRIVSVLTRCSLVLCNS